MNAQLLRRFILEALDEMRDARVPTQLLPKSGKKKSPKDSEEETEEMDEMSGAGAVGGGSTTANITGFTAPLGASNLDMGKKPVSPGGKVKKRKKTYVRWK